MKIIDLKKNVIDTLEIARSKYPGSSNSLDSLCKKFNIDISKRVKHNALLDCELLRQVYINLIGEKEPSLIFKNKNVEVSSTTLAESLDYSKIVIEATAQEKENHKHFLKKELKKNYF